MPDVASSSPSFLALLPDMIRIHTLGRLEASIDGQALAWVHSQRRRAALLVLLAVERDAARERVATVLWPNATPAHARRALNQAVYDLRRRIGQDRVIVSGDRIALGGEVWTDAVAFEEACRTGDQAAALGLYRGRFLEGTHLVEEAEFESWVERHAATLQRQHRTLRRKQIADLIAGRDLGRALEAARGWVAIEPAEDEAHHRLIELLAATGERSEALQHYEAYERTIAEQGLEPLDETRALIESLRAGEAGSLPQPVVMLDEPAPGLATPAPAAPPSPGHEGATRTVAPLWRQRLAAAVALIVLAGAFLTYQRSRDAAPASSPAAPGLAVLPFEVNGAGLDAWREGMVDLFGMNLDGAGTLRVISSRTVLARWRERVPEGAAPDLDAALGVARATGARYALIGSVTGAGNTVRIGARVYDAQDGRALGHAAVSGSPDSVIALVDRISIAIMRAVAAPGILPAAATNLAGATTSLPALKAYLEGRVLERSAAFRDAQAAYYRALALDSTFALAWRGVVSTAGWGAGTALDAATEARAAELLAGTSPRDYAFVRLRASWPRGADPEAIPFGRAAVLQFPDDPDLWYQLGELIWHNGDEALVDSQEAMRAFESAIALDPQFGPYYLHAIEYALSARDTVKVDRLLAAAARSVHSDQEFVVSLRMLSAALRAQGDGVANLRALVDTAALVDVFRVLNPLWTGIVFGNGLTDSSTNLLEFAEPLLLREAERHRRSGELGPPQEIFVAARTATVSMLRGRIGQAVDLLANPAADPYRGMLWYRIHRTRHPLAPGVLDSALAVGRGDTLIGYELSNLAPGVYAAERGNWSEHARARRNAQSAFDAQLRSQATQVPSARDSIRQQHALAVVRTLDAYADALRGNLEPAIAVLEEVRASTGGYQEGVLNAAVRWWLGELHARQQRPEEALRYFMTFKSDPLARLEIARLHEQRGDRAAAHAAYAILAETWKDADPGFPPLSEVRRALGASAPRR